MARESVSRTAGNDAHHRVRMYEGTRHLVDGPVSANGDYHVNTVLGGHGGENGTMAPVFSFLDFP